jgi:hypothetical protein
MKPKPILSILLAFAIFGALAYLAIDTNFGGWFGLHVANIRVST